MANMLPLCGAQVSLPQPCPMWEGVTISPAEPSFLGRARHPVALGAPSFEYLFLERAFSISSRRSSSNNFPPKTYHLASSTVARLRSQRPLVHNRGTCTRTSHVYGRAQGRCRPFSTNFLPGIQQVGCPLWLRLTTSLSAIHRIGC